MTIDVADTDTGTSTNTVQARRRNGKQQACEPCRKAKIACDHSLPFCNRCKRRKVIEKCIYLDAPMTKAPGSSQIRPTIPAGIEVRKAIRQPALPSPSTSATQSIASPTNNVSQLAQSPESTRPSLSTTPFIKSGGFFGPTNFSAVWVENRDNLVSDHEEMQISNDSEDPLPPSESLQSQTFLILNSGDSPNCNPRIELGAKILRALPDQNTCNFLLEWYYSKANESLILKHTVMESSRSLWQTFGSYLSEPRTPENLYHVSSILCKNSKTVLEEPSGPDEYRKWLDSFTGSNMRWETLGTIMSCLAMSILILQAKDAFFSTQRCDRRERKLFAMEMKDCVQTCITLSNWMDLINLQMVQLLARNLVIQTVISGDASLIVWRQVGDLVSCTTALGLHRQAAMAEPITHLTELKKKLFCVVFVMDKNTSILTGRPPALSYHYTRFKLPLDLSEDVLIAGGAVLDEAISKLDKDGWNTDGKIHACTTTRTYALLGILLNEILELSLGDAQNCTEEKTASLMDRLEQTYQELPPWLHYYNAGRKQSDEYFWRTLAILLHWRENRLLLERIAFKNGWRDGQTMVDCASEMLELTVLIWVQRDRFIEKHHDFDWILMVWGIPSCGVLCVELLKQLKNPGAPHPRIKRSETVQNLSLLIGFLEWVQPSAGNYRLCMRMKLIIKRILDQILDPNPNAHAALSSAEGAAGVGTGGGSSVHQQLLDPELLDQPADNNGSNSAMANFDMSGPFDTVVPPPGAFDISSYNNGVDGNLDWLNSIDWSRGPWMEDCGSLKWNVGF